MTKEGIYGDRSFHKALVDDLINVLGLRGLQLLRILLVLVMLAGLISILF